MIHFSVTDEDGEVLCSRCWEVPTTKGEYCSDLCRRWDNFLRKAGEAHGSMYGYEEVEYVRSDIKVKITCPMHGIFEQSPHEHNKGSGCPTCGDVRTRTARRYTTESYVKKARLKHAYTYTYGKVRYIDSMSHITITCPIHGDFDQIPAKHLQGFGCPACKVDKIRGLLSDTPDKVVSKFKAVHGDNYDYSLVKYEGSNIKCDIVCPRHGIFAQTPQSHITGHGCHKCSNNYSKKAIRWLEYMSAKDRVYIQHALNQGEYKDVFKFDGYCEDTNTVYEFYGDYWHGNPLVYAEDHVNKRNNRTMGELHGETIRREEIIKDMGYNLVTMWETEWDVAEKTQLK